ncbi:hypothetical protein F4805DRAFT_459516 [Annulohypoxylon moriforme]|nr:hypothetical protein F4805DRAFT_459516 [Annulohypoxylon moriforme]
MERVRFREVRQHRCTELAGDGAVCGLTFNRKWNFKRHLRNQHRQSQVRPGSTFVVSHPRNDIRVRLPPIRQAVEYLHTPSPEPACGPETFAGKLQGPSEPPGEPPGGERHTNAQPEASPGPQAAKNSRGAPKDLLLGRARLVEVMPTYEVKLSKSQPHQKAIEWLSCAARDVLHARVADIMGSWGVGPSHSGTCVLWPQDWAMLRPSAIVDLLSFESCPLIDSDRAVRMRADAPLELAEARRSLQRLQIFKHSDHVTSLARAIAWFGEWPRSGIQLDNFLECGPFQRMDASHRCHTSLCVNPAHIVYETARLNLGRQDCQREAVRLRIQGRDVPPACDRHDPPCLMQHASLTTFEKCSIQASIFRQVYGLPPPLPPRRPPWHRFPTFEFRLPLQFVQGLTAVRFDPAYGTRQQIGPRPDHPGLVCSFCVRIKSFGGIVALWTHVVRKHRDIPGERKADEVRRTANVWAAYQKAKGNAGSHGDPTSTRLNQVAQHGFSWETVQMWGL